MRLLAKYACLNIVKRRTALTFTSLKLMVCACSFYKGDANTVIIHAKRSMISTFSKDFAKQIENWLT
jgi:hypothetical protein